MTTMTDNWQEVESAASKVLGEEIAALIDKARNEPHSESRLIGVLHKVQETFGYLGKEQLDAVAQLLQVPAAKVSGVASFYHFFRLTPRGKYVIHVCMGTACYVKGADRIAQKFMEELGIAWGETSSDRIFTLEGSRCLGTCGLAPVVMIGDDIHGNVTADQVPIILDTYLKRAKEEA
ncbi:MAG: NADH-quinone oxidoreductase subunit NuoE [Patescibacteria group bacterium]|nr:NADH-quinone oxidoreductase subunit NuoE [Patescibacteria group bacterium]